MDVGALREIHVCPKGKLVIVRFEVELLSHWLPNFSFQGEVGLIGRVGCSGVSPFLKCESVTQLTGDYTLLNPSIR